jgi:hypothetical protein
VVASCREVALVGGDAQSVDLRVGVLDGSGADAGEGFPEPESMSIIYSGRAISPRSSIWNELVQQRHT